MNYGTFLDHVFPTCELHQGEEISSEMARCCLRNVQRGSSVVECRTRNQVSPGSNPPLLPFRRLCISVLSIEAPVDSAV